MTAAVALSAAALLAAPGYAQTFEAQALDIRDVFGVVLIRTSDRTDIEARIDPGAGLMAAPEATLDEGVLVIAGPRGYRHSACRTRNDVQEIQLSGGAYQPLTAFPSLIIDAPVDARLTLAGGVVFGDAGPLATVELSLDGCGDFELADVAGVAELTVNGGGALTLAQAQSADITVNGGGAVRAGPLRGDVRVTVNGAGDARLASIDGEAELLVRGSGDIVVAAGRATAFDAAIYGSGDIRFSGVAVDPRITIFGTGDARLAAFDGALRVRRSGTGDVRVGD